MAISILFSSCQTAKLVEYTDSREPSQEPPMGLSVEEVPMFVAIGFDDNAYSEGLKWIDEYSKDLKNSDGTPVKFSFFNAGKYSDSAGEEWYNLYKNGHEIGNHSFSHPHGSKTYWSKSPATYEVLMTQDQWAKEMVDTDETQVGLGIPLKEMRGFRNPFLEYTDQELSAAYERGFHYDCSIEEGYQGNIDGTNNYWPYTLDNGSPGNVAVSEWLDTRDPIGSYPGLWELPVYALIVPPDELAEKYDFPVGLRKKINDAKPYIEGSNWKITGFDYNLWRTDSGTDMLNGQEFLAILKYNLDLRLEGNKAPFMLGAHIDEYTTDEKRKAIEDFVEYALSKEDVKVTSFYNILQWLKDPVAIN